MHAPHSPTRQHSFVPVRPQVVAQRLEQRVVRLRRRPTARRPLTRQRDRDPRPSRRRRADGRSRPRRPRSPSTRSIASRYSGLARIDVGDGLASANSASSSAASSASVARASASSPLASARSSGRGPTLPYASRVTPSARRRSTPASRTRGRGRAAASAAGARTRAAPSGSGSSIAVDELARRERRDARTGRRSRRARCAGRPPGPTRDDLRAVDEQRRRRVRRRRRVAELPGERRPVPDLDRPDVRAPPRPAPGSRAGRRRRPRCRSSSSRAEIRTRAVDRSIRASSSAIRLTSTTTCGRNVPSRRRMTRSVPPARSARRRPWSAEQRDRLRQAGRPRVGEGVAIGPRGPGRLRRAGPAASRPGRSSTDGRRTARRSRPGPRRSASVSTIGIGKPGASSSLSRK